MVSTDALGRSYDAKGNQLSAHFHSSGSDYSYDFENHLPQTATTSGLSEGSL